MLKTILLAAIPLAPVAPGSVHASLAATAQDKAELRKELEAKVAEAAGNANALFAAALWAERKGLASDAKKVLRKVLEVDSDHASARKALGYVKLDGEWILEKDVEKHKERIAAEKARKEAAEYRKKGYVQHEGSWVKKSEIAWAKLGLVRHDGRWVRISDKKELDAGKVRHPRTGLWIAKADLEKAQNGQYRTGDAWSDLDRANAYHSSLDTPWELWTDNVTLRTTMPLDKAEAVASEAETAVIYARNLIFDPTMPLPKRVLVYAFPDAESYREFGARNDETGFSAYGCFYAFELDGKPVALNYGHKDWSPYYLKHAVGLAACASLVCDQGIEPTSWLLTGMGSYVERWSNEAAQQHFGRQYLQKGGVRSLKSFPKRFQISGDQAPADMEWNIYQAGILVAYVAQRPDKTTRKAWDKLRTAIRDGKGAKRALAGLERALIRAEQNIRDHLKRLVTG